MTWEHLYLCELFNILSEQQKDEIFEDIVSHLTSRQIVEAANRAKEKENSNE